MHGVLLRTRLLHAVFAAAMRAQQLNPVEREHVGVDIDDGHGAVAYSMLAPDFCTTAPQRVISDLMNACISATGGVSSGIT